MSAQVRMAGQDMWNKTHCARMSASSNNPQVEAQGNRLEAEV